MSAYLQLRPRIAHVRRWCLQRVSRACPGKGRGGVRRLSAAAEGRRVPAAPGASVRAASRRGSRPPWLRYTRGNQGRVPCWRDRLPVLRLYDQLEPSPGVGDPLREIDRPDRDLRGIGSSRLRRPTVPVPDCAVASHDLRGALFRRSWTVPRSHELRPIIPGPGGRDLAEVALVDLAMTRPGTVRPHQGLYRLSDIFLNIST